MTELWDQARYGAQRAIQPAAHRAANGAEIGEEPGMAEDLLDGIVGKPAGTTVVTVERGQLQLFADAVKERSPIYRDARAANDAGLPAIPAPPTYPFVMGMFGVYPELQPGDQPDENPMTKVLSTLLAGGGMILHGEQEFTYHRPVLAGDVLVGTASVVDAYRKESKGRTMTFVVVETAWNEQATGDPVCTSRMNIMHRS
jgi:acyl dehydratase